MNILQNVNECSFRVSNCNICFVVCLNISDVIVTKKSSIVIKGNFVFIK